MTYSSRSAISQTTQLRLLLILLLVLPAYRLHGEGDAASDEALLRRLTVIVDGLRQRLEMPQRVRIVVALHNKRMVSVERFSKPEEQYLLTFDRQFLNDLTENELTAAIAHELGHVWIFSHHPYLQTEELANQIALRTVERDSLEHLYSKLWSHLGTTGNLEELLGPKVPNGPETLETSLAIARSSQSR